MSVRLFFPLLSGTGCLWLSLDAHFMKPSYRLPSIHHSIHPSTDTAFQSHLSPTFGFVHIPGCSLLCNCHLTEALNCKTAVYFLNYARIDLLVGKYLACLSPAVHSVVKSCYNISSLWCVLTQQAGADYFSTGLCARGLSGVSSLSHPGPEAPAWAKRFGNSWSTLAIPRIWEWCLAFRRF